MPRPKDVKKSEHVARCVLLDEERLLFSDLVDFILDLVPLQLSGGSTENYLRIGILRPEGNLRLSRLLASAFRIVALHSSDVAVDVGSKAGTGACYTMWTGMIPTRSRVRVIKASVTRDQQTGSSQMWFQGWAPAMHAMRTAFVGGPSVLR